MWDLNSAKEIQKLTGMENAVTAIALDENTVVTTSTGMKDAMNKFNAKQKIKVKKEKPEEKKEENKEAPSADNADKSDKTEA